MFKNHFKVTLRSLKKNSGYASLNILGLSTGIAACLLLMLHISYQLTYDQHVPDNDRVYRLVNDMGNSDKYGSYTSGPLVQHMLLDFPEIESGTRVSGMSSQPFKIGDKSITQHHIIGADSTFFDVFPTNFIYGEAITALTSPNSIVLTESVAKKVFPKMNPMGLALLVGGETYTVTAVVEDEPKNSTIPYEVISSFPHDTWITAGYWTGNNFYSYLKLKENIDIDGLKDKFPDFAERHIAGELIGFMEQYDSWGDFLADGNWMSFELIPLLDIHLHHANLSLNHPSSISSLVTYMVIAVFILLIACINYINMVTARASLRFKEVGVRKVLGSPKSQLVQQFLSESMLITLLSVLIGILMALYALPYFNSLTSMSYDWTSLLNPDMWIKIVILTVMTGLVAGSYPALYLSSISPIATLRKVTVRGNHWMLRNILMIFQFAISIFMVTATFIVYHQVEHVSSRNLGIEADRIIVVKNEGKLTTNYQAFANELLSSPLVESVGVMSHYPAGSISDWQYYTSGDHKVTLNPDHVFTDEFALQTIGATLSEGAYFNGIVTDSLHVIVNKTFVKKAGWENPIGQIVRRGNNRNFAVIGVIEDFVLRNGNYNTRPAIFRYASKTQAENTRNYIHLKTTGRYDESMFFVAQTWEKYVKDEPFDGFFLDHAFNNLYNEQRKFGQVFTTFSGLTILIAFIGLFSLTAFTLEQKMKEIAIRKVMGASSEKIIAETVYNFLRLILIGAVIAFPGVYYLGNQWLNGFDYRIVIDFWLIISPIATITLFSILIVSLKTYRTAIDNPINALNVE